MLFILHQAMFVAAWQKTHSFNLCVLV